MKISMSPGHNRDPPSTRRLRHNRSVRQSPMPRGARPFDNNHEPSSPKVTCIGQVRVKARKKHHALHNNISNVNNRILHRNLSTNRADGNLLQDRNRGEVSFRRVDKNQKWVHFPLTICEALSCLFPCRTPSCLSNDTGRENGEKDRGEGSCGAVFARWLVAVEGGKREIEDERDTGFRRHGVGEIEVEQGRVSICVPPKNALLLMRCRSDPLRVNALANRLWECRERTEEEDEDEGEREIGVKRKDLIFLGEFDDFEKLDLTKSIENDPFKKNKENAAMGIDKGGEVEDLEAEKSDIDLEKVRDDESGDESSGFSSESVETIAELEFCETDELKIKETMEHGIEETANLLIEKTEVSDIGVAEESEIGKIEVLEIGEACELVISQTEELVIGEIDEFEVGVREDSLIKTTGELVIETTEELVTGKTDELVDEELRRTSRYSCSSVISLHLDIAEGEPETAEPRFEETDEEEEKEEKENEESEAEERECEPVLPDCLLMMRYEPKLSMEVSKETWICSTDFIRWLPKRRPKPNKIIDGGEEPKKKRTTTDCDAPLPPRSSCSFPLPPPPTSMAAMIEQRLMSAVAYEPFVLTRCKSEPMRTAAAKLIPETCFWKNRKLEPHRSANFGVNAAGLGF